MEINSFKDIKILIEKYTKCLLEYVSPTEFSLLEPYQDSLDGIGYNAYNIVHDGTVDSMINSIKKEYCGYNVFSNKDYYKDVVMLFSGLTIE